MRPLTRGGAACLLALGVLSGCFKGTPTPDPGTVQGTAGRQELAREGPESASNEPQAAELNGELSRLILETTNRYRPLKYDYNEDLLETMDRVEARLSGKSEKLDPLPISTLDESEQLDHFRETIRRWSATTKMSLRDQIAPLKAEVAARKPGGPAFHPEFHKKFAVVFDSFIPIEVTEMRERRNRMLHAKAKPVLDEFRPRAPEAVRQAEKTLNSPPYNLPSPPTEGRAA